MKQLGSVFSYYFCLLIEGSCSGSGRPKNIWILRIRIRNTGYLSSFMLQVWGASNMAVLLKARTLAHRRRLEWEEWAVRKHGSLQTAFSNPRYRYQLSAFWGTVSFNQSQEASTSVKPSAGGRYLVIL
jgi:hypothetical protein